MVSCSCFLDLARLFTDTHSTGWPLSILEVKSIQMGSAATPPNSFLPIPIGWSKPTQTVVTILGWIPANHASLASLVVPVLPPTSERPNARALIAVPRWMTSRKIFAIWNATLEEIIRGACCAGIYWIGIGFSLSVSGPASYNCASRDAWRASICWVLASNAASSLLSFLLSCLSKLSGSLVLASGFALNKSDFSVALSPASASPLWPLNKAARCFWKAVKLSSLVCCKSLLKHTAQACFGLAWYCSLPL